MVGAPQLPLRGRDRPLETIRRLLHGVFGKASGPSSWSKVEPEQGNRVFCRLHLDGCRMSFRTGLGRREPGGTWLSEPLLDATFQWRTPLIDRNSLSDVHARPN